MKKNKALTAAISVLSLTMVSLCAIGGTFAKYASQDTSEDTAKVAKWGVEIVASSENVFGEKYDNEISASGSKVVSVEADNDEVDGSVLAPGTNGTLGSVTITGQPEVMVNISVTLDLELSGWSVGSPAAEYCPLVFNGTIKWGSAIDNSIDSDDDGVISTVDELELAVETAAAKEGTNVGANTNLATNYDSSVSWEWPFHTTDENDVKDSLLGDAATATITATWNASVTQVD